MRVRRMTIGASISIFLFLWSPPTYARDDGADLRSRVLRELPEALRALEEHFSKAVGSVNYSLKNRIGKRRSSDTAGKFTFASRRPYWARVTSHRTKAAKSSGPSPEGKTVPEVPASLTQDVVYCHNKDYSFELTKSEADAQYVIRSFDKSVNGVPPRGSTVQIDGWLYEYLDAPFSFSAVYQPLSRVISSDRFSIQRISEVRQDGENCLKLEIRLEEGMWKIATGEPSPQYDGWILVAPEKKWALREYELGPSTLALRGHVEYGDIEDGFPVPKRVVIEAMDPRSREPYYIHEFTFEDLRLVDTPDREFTLAAFGLPELAQPGSSRHGSRIALWWLGAALASLVAAIVLKYYSVISRRTRPGSTAGAA
jgi:hypothetical protein